MEKGTKDNPHTILSSMEDIVVKAKEHGLDEIFYSESENSMKRLSRALLMSKEELFPGMDLIQKDEQQDRRLIPYTSFVKNHFSMRHKYRRRLIDLLNFWIRIDLLRSLNV